MGTGISLFAEKRVGQSWHPVPEPGIDPKSGQAVPVVAMDVGRPYQLFSLLSGSPVGLRSGLVELPSIFKPRGLPDDMNPVYREVLPAWYDGDWGASWLGLRELVDLHWDQKLHHHAYVEEQYATYFHPDEDFPAAFPKDGNLYHGLFGPPPAGTCKVVWSITLRAYAGCSEWFIERLLALAPESELRIIYWFNS